MAASPGRIEGTCAARRVPPRGGDWTWRRARRSLLPALLGLLACSAFAGLPCPDARAIELYERAGAQMASRDDLAAIILEATRPIEQPARIRACRRLAIALDNREQRMEQARSNPRKWPPGASDNDDATLEDLRPALEICPHFARPPEPPLPIMRARVQPADEVIRDDVTGWVEVDAVVDARGNVTATEVVASSDPRLEPWAQRSVELSIYRPPTEYGSIDGTMRARQIVVTDAFDIARARGCVIEGDNRGTAIARESRRAPD